MTDELLKWRAEFPILEKTVYLVSHSLGAMPRGVYDKMREYADVWATRGVRAWSEGWWEMPGNVGNMLAKIIDAPENSVVMHQNVSIAQSLILSCFEPDSGRNKIVYEELNFPSVMYVYEAHARNGKFRIETVKSSDGMTIDLQKMLDAIDEETLLVPVSHVLFKSSFLQDAAAIIEKAHSVGAYVVLDTYQSAGTVPFSAKDLNVDFVVGGSVKWLCGGAGAGYLYVRPDLQTRLEPKITGWSAHAEPFAFLPGDIEYSDSIERFLHGSPSIPALYSAQSGYKIIAEIGVDKIREKSRRQTQNLIIMAESEGFAVTSPKNPDERGGTICVAHERADSMAKELVRREFIVDFRPGAGIRVSPHFYTKDEELELFIKELKDIRDTKAYERHQTAKTAF
ncbi:MAG TPA: aminotransferase class V-fold PLP-dependent enzyme [Pyrinomonadaceae bacterium]|nr:aminotransferase class V-fold PLP-dependent enzyme [Pyrinomonadaceae bacterium]